MTDDPGVVGEKIAGLRRPHEDRGLDVGDLDRDPIRLFARWMDEALDAEPFLPNAMTLATVGLDGKPSARTVLLKGLDDRGFTFFTNYRSRKGIELEAHPHAAIAIHWPSMERQVSARGDVERLGADESDAYFATRPLGSRIGAWASSQSQPLSDRAALDDAAAAVAARYPKGDIPRPPHWGGYLIVPFEIEFWQARSDRLHDRFRYSRRDGGWSIERLSP